MTEGDLTKAAEHVYPGYKVIDVFEPRNPNQATEITLKRGERTTVRLFHPYTGEDLGNSLRAGYRFISWLLDFHDDLLGGNRPARQRRRRPPVHHSLLNRRRHLVAGHQWRGGVTSGCGRRRAGSGSTGTCTARTGFWMFLLACFMWGSRDLSLRSRTRS